MQQSFSEKELGYCASVVQVEQRDRDIEAGVADESEEGGICHAERPVSGHSTAKNLYLVDGDVFKTLIDNDIGIDVPFELLGCRLVIDISHDRHFLPAEENDRVRARPLKPPRVLARPVKVEPFGSVLDHCDPKSARLQQADDFFDERGFAAVRACGNEGKRLHEE